MICTPRDVSSGSSVYSLELHGTFTFRPVDSVRWKSVSVLKSIMAEICFMLLVFPFASMLPDSKSIKCSFDLYWGQTWIKVSSGTKGTTATPGRPKCEWSGNLVLLLSLALKGVKGEDLGGPPTVFTFVPETKAADRLEFRPHHQMPGNQISKTGFEFQSS